MFMPVASASFLNSPSSLASVCQFPSTRSSMANSLPSEVMRLSLMLPPQSAIALESSCTMPTRSPPTALITICCFIDANSTGWRLPRCSLNNYGSGISQRGPSMRGSLVAIVTPMSVDGSLDLGGWDRLLDFHLAEGTEGIVIAGTTGESPSLTLEETEELARRAVAHCAGKIPLIVGTGTNSTPIPTRRRRRHDRHAVF